MADAPGPVVTGEGPRPTEPTQTTGKKTAPAAVPAPQQETPVRTAAEDAATAATAAAAVRAELAREVGTETAADKEPRLPDKVVTWKENMLRGKYKDWGYPGALPHDKFDEIDRRLTDKFSTDAEIGDSAVQTELREIVNELKNNPEYNGSILTLDNPSQISQLLDRFPQAYDDEDKEGVLEAARKLAEEGKIQFPEGFHFDVVFAQEDPDGPRAGEITVTVITLQPGAPEPHPLPSYYFEEQGHAPEEAQRLADEFNAKQLAETGAGRPLTTGTPSTETPPVPPDAVETRITEVSEGMTLVNRDRGDEWTVESVTEKDGRRLVHMRGPDGQRFNRSEESLLEIVNTPGGAWRLPTPAPETTTAGGAENPDTTSKIGAVVIETRENKKIPDGAQEVARILIEDGEREFAVALGSITEVEAEAICVPSNPWFAKTLGRIERTLANDIDKLAGTPDGSAADQFFEETKKYAKEHGKEGPSPDGEGTVFSLPFGEIAVFPNEHMKKRGIGHIVMMNPATNEGEKLGAEEIRKIVKNALIKAGEAGASSLAFPDLGEGLWSDIENKQSDRNTWPPVLLGFLDYIEAVKNGEITEAAGGVKKLILVEYKPPTDEHGSESGKILREIVNDIKKGKEKTRTASAGDLQSASPLPPEPAPVRTAQDGVQPAPVGGPHSPPPPAPIEGPQGGEPAAPGVAPITRAEEPPTPPEPPREDLRADQVTDLSMAAAKQRIGGDKREEKEAIQKEIELLAQERREQSRDDIPDFLRHPIRYFKAHGFRINMRENYMDARLTQYHEQQAREILAGLGMQISGLPREFQRQLREAAQQRLIADADERGLTGRERKRWLKGKHKEQRQTRKAENKQRKAQGREKDSYIFAATREQHAIDRQELRLVRALRESAFLSQDEINSRPDNDDVKRLFGNGRNGALLASYRTILNGDFEATQTLAARASQQLGPDAIRATIGEKMGTARISEGMEKYLKEKVLQPFMAEALSSGGAITDELRLKFRNNAQGIFFTREFAEWQQQMAAQGNRSLDLSLSYGMDGLEQYAEQAVTRLKEHYRGHEHALQKLDVFMQSVTFAEVSVGTLKAGESVDIEKNWWQKKISRAITARQVHEMYRTIQGGTELQDLAERFAPAAYDAALERARFLARASGKGIIGPGSMTLAVLTGVGIGTSQGLLRWGGGLGAGAAIGSVALLGTPLAPTILAAAVVAGGVKYFQERRRSRRETSQVAIQTARGGTAPDNAPRRQAIEKRLFKGRNAGEVIASLTAQRDALRELNGQPVPEAVLANLLTNLADMQARDRLAVQPRGRIPLYRRGSLSEMYNATGGERDAMMILRAEVMQVLRTSDLTQLGSLQSRMGITGDLDSTIGTLATHIESNLDTGQRIDASLRAVLGEGIQSSESMKTRERVLRRYRHWRGIKMGAITTGSVLVGSQTVGRGVSFAVSHISNFIGIGSAGGSVAKAIENGAKRGATPEAAYQEFLNQNPAPEGTQWVPNPEKPNSFDLVFKDQRLDNVGENPILRPLINDLHQTNDGVWTYDVTGSDVQPEQFEEFVKGDLAEGLTAASQVETMPVVPTETIREFFESRASNPFFEGTHFEVSADGNSIDIIRDDNGQTLVNNLRFDEQGSITWDADSSPKAVEQFSEFYNQIAAEAAQPVAQETATAWAENSTDITKWGWYNELIAGQSDQNELSLHDYRAGDHAVRWDVTHMQGMSTNTAGILPPVDIQQAIANQQVAMAFWEPGQEGEAILVKMNSGQLTLDQNSTGMVTAYIDGQWQEVPESTIAKMVFSENLGDFQNSSNATGFMDKFNVNSSAVLVDENGDGTVSLRSLATSQGFGDMPSQITIPGQELPPLNPPEPLPPVEGQPPAEDGTSNRSEFPYDPFPVLIPVTRRPVEPTRRGEQRDGVHQGRERQPLPPRIRGMVIPMNDNTFFKGRPLENILLPYGEKIQYITLNYKNGGHEFLPLTVTDPNNPNLTHTLRSVSLSPTDNTTYEAVVFDSDGVTRNYPLAQVMSWHEAARPLSRGERRRQQREAEAQIRQQSQTRQGQQPIVTLPEGSPGSFTNPYRVGEHTGMIPLGTRDGQPPTFRGRRVIGIDISNRTGDGRIHFFLDTTQRGNTEPLSASITRQSADGTTYTIRNIFVDPTNGYVATVADQAGAESIQRLHTVLSIWRDAPQPRQENRQVRAAGEQQAVEQTQPISPTAGKSTGVATSTAGSRAPTARASVSMERAIPTPESTRGTFRISVPLENPINQYSQIGLGQFVLDAKGDAYIVTQIRENEIVVASPDSLGHTRLIPQNDFHRIGLLTDTPGNPVGIADYLTSKGYGETGIQRMRHFIHEATKEPHAMTPHQASQFFFAALSYLQTHTPPTQPERRIQYIDAMYRQFTDFLPELPVYPPEIIQKGKDVARTELAVMADLMRSPDLNWENQTPISKDRLKGINRGDFILTSSGDAVTVSSIDGKTIHYHTFNLDGTPGPELEVDPSYLQSYGLLTAENKQAIGLKNYLERKSRLPDHIKRQVLAEMDRFFMNPQIHELTHTKKTDNSRASQLFLSMFLNIRRLDTMGIARPTTPYDIEAFMQSVYQPLETDETKRREVANMMYNLYATLTRIIPEPSDAVPPPPRTDPPPVPDPVRPKPGWFDRGTITGGILPIGWSRDAYRAIQRRKNSSGEGTEAQPVAPVAGSDTLRARDLPREAWRYAQEDFPVMTARWRDRLQTAKQAIGHPRQTASVFRDALRKNPTLPAEPSTTLGTSAHRRADLRRAAPSPVTSTAVAENPVVPSGTTEANDVTAPLASGSTGATEAVNSPPIYTEPPTGPMAAVNSEEPVETDSGSGTEVANEDETRPGPAIGANPPREPGDPF